MCVYIYICVCVCVCVKYGVSPLLQHMCSFTLYGGRGCRWRLNELFQDSGVTRSGP